MGRMKARVLLGSRWSGDRASDLGLYLQPPHYSLTEHSAKRSALRRPQLAEETAALLCKLFGPSNSFARSPKARLTSRAVSVRNYALRSNSVNVC